MKKKNGSVIIWIVLVLCLALEIGIFTYAECHYLGQQNIVKCPKVSDDFTQMLDTIQANCGSTYLTQQYGETVWSVFTNICNAEGYCKDGYIHLEDCLR